MPKSKKPVAKKIFKVKRKTLDDDKNNFVIRFKGDWQKDEIKLLRSVLDDACKGVMHDLKTPPVEAERDEY